MHLTVERLEERALLSLATFDSLTPVPDAYDPSSILVRFHEGASATILDGAVLDPEIALVPGLHTVHLPAGVSVAAALKAYQASPLVRYAEPNYTVRVAAVPNDPDYPQQCGMQRIRADAAWDLWVGSFNTTVAVLDTGIDYNHRDLAINIWVKQSEIPASRRANLIDLDGDGRITIWELNTKFNQGPDRITDQTGEGWITAADLLIPTDGSLGGWADGVDDDGNGRVDDLVGWNFVANNRTPLDDNGHGTHGAGIIGAEGNNGVGVVGVNWYTQLMPVKFLNAQGGGSLNAALEALNYAVANGARVSNNGWGGTQFSQAFQDALMAARDMGHIFVASAGGSNIDLDQRPQYPASYPVENVFVATTTDCDDRRAPFANYGVNTVDLSAPGVGIHSTSRGGGYATLSGTSMSTAHLTGAVALLWDAYPFLSYDIVMILVLVTVDPLAPPCYTFSCGRLNIGRAVGFFGGGGAPGSGSAPGEGVPTPPRAPDADVAAVLATLARRRGGGWMEEADLFGFTTP